MPKFLKFLKSIFNFKVISTLLVVILVINIALVGCLAPKRQPAEAMDFLGAAADWLAVIWDVVKAGWEKVQSAYHSAADWISAKLALSAKVKEWIAKAMRIAGYVLMHQILNMITNQIIAWINGGGKPRFISDWKGFLKTAGDRAAGAFLNQLAGINLCEPFRLDLQLALLPTTNFPEDVSCSFSEMGQFFDDFRDGGWQNWVKLTSPQNNFFGAYFKGIDVRMSAEAAAEKAAENEAVASKGFFGARCDAEMANAGKCNLGDIITPGESISFMTNKSLSKDMDVLQLSLADLTDSLGTYSPYVIAIANALINRVMKEGLALAVGDDSDNYVANTGISIPPVDSSTAAQATNNKAYGNTLIEQQRTFKDMINNTYIPALGEKLALLREMFDIEYDILTSNVIDMLNEDCAISTLNYTLGLDPMKEATSTTEESASNETIDTTIEYYILDAPNVGTAEITKTTELRRFLEAGRRTTETTIAFEAIAAYPKTNDRVQETLADIANAREHATNVDTAINSIDIYVAFLEQNESQLETISTGTTDGETFTSTETDNEDIKTEAQELYTVAIQDSRDIVDSSATNFQELIQDTQTANNDMGQETGEIKTDLGIDMGGFVPSTGLKKEFNDVRDIQTGLTNVLDECLNPSSTN